MKRLIVITIIISCAAAAFAAQKFNEFPLINFLRDDSRMLIHSNYSTRNISGLALKQEISAYAHLSAARRIGTANQIFDLITSANSKKLVKRAAVGAGPYARVFEIKDGTGKIVQWTSAAGAMYFGTPLPLSIASVYPTNGATGVSNGTLFHYSSTTGGWDYWKRINTTIPAVTFNKSTDVSISNLYIVGSSIAPQDIMGTAGIVWSFGNFSGTPGTMYTIRVVRGSITQTDGETASSCGTAMTDISGICTSTFTMR